MSDGIHLAIYQTKDFTLVIEYEPLNGGAIDITNVDLQPHAVSHFEQREKERRAQRVQNKNTKLHSHRRARNRS